jgi:AcrR family transcriptional regulator
MSKYSLKERETRGKRDAKREMTRPFTISTERILDAAREVFLQKGIQATTAEVARRAGVAEGSIFKRFQTKHELFLRAMEPTLQDPEFLRKLPQRVGTGDLRQNLLEFGTEMLAFLRPLMPLMMMSWSNRECGLPSHLARPNPPPQRALQRIAAYFEAEMRLERLGRHDPEVLARVFTGSVQNYVFHELLLQAHDEQPLSAEVYLRGLVDLIWSGAAPARREEPS